MLPKKNRAGTREVETVFKKGKLLVSNALSLRYIKSASEVSKISFIVPKTVSKSAVKRNTLRRLGYEALRLIPSILPSSILGVFVFKKAQEDITIIENEIKILLHKVN